MSNTMPIDPEAERLRIEEADRAYFHSREKCRCVTTRDTSCRRYFGRWACAICTRWTTRRK